MNRITMADGVSTEIIDVTPAMAAKWLEANTKNRPINKGTWLRYLSDMKAGRWQYVADPIRFAADGSLLDGQHRLMAIAQMPYTFSEKFLVVRGLVPQAQLLMDQGRKRTTGDQLGLIGILHRNQISSGVKLYLEWTHGVMFSANYSRQSISTMEIVEFCEDNPDIIEWLCKNMSPLTNFPVPSTPPTALAIAAYRIDPDLAQEFLTRAYTMTDLAEGDPILVMTRKLKGRPPELAKGRTGGRWDRRYALGVIIQGWNAWVDNKKIARIPVVRWTSETFPVPVGT